MTAHLVVVVVEAFDGRVLDRAGHAFDLAAIQKNDPPDRLLIFMAPRVLWSGCAMKRDKAEFSRAINGREAMGPDLRRLHLGNKDLKETGRACLELLFRGQVAVDLRKPGYASTLKSSTQGRPARMRNCRLKRIKPVAGRKQFVPAQGDDVRLFFDRKPRRLRLLRARRHIKRRWPLRRLGDRLLIDATRLANARSLA